MCTACGSCLSIAKRTLNAILDIQAKEMVLAWGGRDDLKAYNITRGVDGPVDISTLQQVCVCLYGCREGAKFPSSDFSLATGCCCSTLLNLGPFSRDLKKYIQPCLCFHRSPQCCWASSSSVASMQQSPNSRQISLLPHPARLPARLPARQRKWFPKQICECPWNDTARRTGQKLALQLTFPSHVRLSIHV